ncbi:50S ribosomal protein L19e [Pyrobaculum aerophilum]|uniref:Large ribosomal subunit protein eL19 n=2 Tax=Pyrobaculum aerophilum TaxID=13773 RepID=Q8ZVV8_PYRAE|nr:MULTISPECIES: 50S ribosomal protein L19e [Pyrobaculum]AAL63946.1 ribosomal protein L19 [Pyrobaculum aerophilum str. IM2]MCX8137527.1 50S ribosomal protein L19e [Pyrobaculum aerophilum]HII46492.1 50S ribosomal protein L19e [Pyrobaculum aerophilum]
MVDVKRLAADILGVGVSRIKISPEAAERLEEVVTKDDVRALIDQGLIWAEPERGVSRGRWRVRHIKKKKGRRRGHGSRKGPRTDEEEAWKEKVRAMRRFLNTLKRKGKLEPRVWRQLYRMVKGNYFRDLDHLKTYINEHKLAKEPVR